MALFALSQGASPLIVGTLGGALATTGLAVPAGRHSDRVGVRTPMLVGSCGIMRGAALPCVVPGIAPLFVATSLIGVAFMVFQVSMQNATGWYGSASDRARNFSLVALGYSISLFGGPLIAGLLIDHASFKVTFGVLALFPLIPIFFLARKSIALPGGHRAATEAPQGGLLDLLRSPQLRRVYLINGLLSMAWDLHSFFIPIYGASIGLSASRIGVILASFAAATFVVRLLMPRIVRHFSELEVLTVALFIAGSVFALFPFVEKLAALMALSFTLGLGLGMSQPMVMSLLYSLAPAGDGRGSGRAHDHHQRLDFRHAALFGAVGSTLGLSPVFWTVGAALGGAGVLARRAAVGR